MFSKEAINSVIDLLFHGNGINAEFIKDTGINFTNETHDAEIGCSNKILPAFCWIEIILKFSISTLLDATKGYHQNY